MKFKISVMLICFLPFLLEISRNSNSLKSIRGLWLFWVHGNLKIDIEYNYSFPLIFPIMKHAHFVKIFMLGVFFGMSLFGHLSAQGNDGKVVFAVGGVNLSTNLTKDERQTAGIIVGEIKDKLVEEYQGFCRGKLEIKSDNWDKMKEFGFSDMKSLEKYSSEEITQLHLPDGGTHIIFITIDKVITPTELLTNLKIEVVQYIERRSGGNKVVKKFADSQVGKESFDRPFSQLGTPYYRGLLVDTAFEKVFKDKNIEHWMGTDQFIQCTPDEDYDGDGVKNSLDQFPQDPTRYKTETTVTKVDSPNTEVLNKKKPKDPSPLETFVKNPVTQMAAGGLVTVTGIAFIADSRITYATYRDNRDLSNPVFANQSRDEYLASANRKLATGITLAGVGLGGIALAYALANKSDKIENRLSIGHMYQGPAARLGTSSFGIGYHINLNKLTH